MAISVVLGGVSPASALVENPTGNDHKICAADIEDGGVSYIRIRPSQYQEEIDDPIFDASEFRTVAGSFGQDWCAGSGIFDKLYLANDKGQNWQPYHFVDNCTNFEAVTSDGTTLTCDNLGAPGLEYSDFDCRPENPDPGVPEYKVTPDCRVDYSDNVVCSLYADGSQHLIRLKGELPDSGTWCSQFGIGTNKFSFEGRCSEDSMAALCDAVSNSGNSVITQADLDNADYADSDCVVFNTGDPTIKFRPVQDQCMGSF